MFPLNWTIHLERMTTILTTSVWHMYVPSRSACSCKYCLHCNVPFSVGCISTLTRTCGCQQTAFEDTYLTILNTDGPEWTDKLRLQMHDVNREGVDDFADEQSWLLSSKATSV
jgi:hypothetical protein